VGMRMALLCPARTVLCGLLMDTLCPLLMDCAPLLPSTEHKAGIVPPGCRQERMLPGDSKACRSMVLGLP
jgi:hypothetical protein